MMISARNLTLAFDGVSVFEGVSFEVERGGSLAFCGPSGGGKSCLLKIVAGLLAPSSGDLELGSKDIGMLFQKNALFDSLTVEENLLVPLRERKRMRKKPAREKAAQALEMVGLAGTQALFPDELSGGMQKRLGIARALITEPAIMLYDDPTAGLDPITSRMIADVILSLRKSAGTTLLVVSNEINRAHQLGDEVALLEDGRLYPESSPEFARFARGDRAS